MKIQLQSLNSFVFLKIHRKMNSKLTENSFSQMMNIQSANKPFTCKINHSKFIRTFCIYRLDLKWSLFSCLKITHLPREKYVAKHWSIGLFKRKKVCYKIL